MFVKQEAGLGFGTVARYGNKGGSPLRFHSIRGVSNYYRGDLRVKSSKHSLGTA